MDRWAPKLAGVELKTGSHGVFEVDVDGQRIFSKANLDRFPKQGEIAKLLEPTLGPSPAWRSGH